MLGWEVDEMYEWTRVRSRETCFRRPLWTKVAEGSDFTDRFDDDCVIFQ